MKALRHTPAAPSRCDSAAHLPRASRRDRRSIRARASSTARRVVGQLERQHHDGDRAVRRARVVGLGRIEDAAVRRIEAGLRDRAHRARRREEIWKRTAPPSRNFGRSCRRIHACVMTPRIPSEPISMRSGLGPAPEPGRRRLSITPLGVTVRSDSTKSSMCV